MLFLLEVEINILLGVFFFFLGKSIWIPLVMQICCKETQRWMLEKPGLKADEKLWRKTTERAAFAGAALDMQVSCSMTTAFLKHLNRPSLKNAFYISLVTQYSNTPLFLQNNFPYHTQVFDNFHCLVFKMPMVVHDSNFKSTSGLQRTSE